MIYPKNIAKCRASRLLSLSSPYEVSKAMVFPRPPVVSPRVVRKKSAQAPLISPGVGFGP